MTTDQAKQLLAIYRPGVDDRDPQFAEALALARQDAALGQWMAEHQAFDSAVRAKLRQATVPIGLKTRILANTKAARSTTWWRIPVWLGAAAALLVVLSVWWQNGRGDDFGRFRQQMVAFVSVDYKLDVQSATLEQALSAFAQAGWPGNFKVPDIIRKLHIEGGCKLHWRDAKVSLVCCETDAETDVWLFVVPNAAFPSPKSEKVAVAGFPTEAWADAQYTYLLVTETVTH